jgi:hypothetical protein
LVIIDFARLDGFVGFISEELGDFVKECRNEVDKDKGPVDAEVSYD